MKKRILLVILACCLCIFSSCRTGSRRMIVVLEDTGMIQSLLVELDAESIAVIERLDIINGVLCELSAGQQAALERMVGIAYIEPDYAVSILDTPSAMKVEAQEVVPAFENIDWGMYRINAPEAWEIATGVGIKVGVIDTGIDTDHPDLIGAVAGGYSAIGSSYEDDNNHGTAVSTVIAARKNGVGIIGIAPGCTLYAIKVLNAKGSGWISDIVKGYQWALGQELDVVNMSLGSYNRSQALIDAMDAAAAQGMATVCASGNDGKASVCYPARNYNALVVGASGYEDTRVEWSNYGEAMKKNGILAPGDWVLAGNKSGTWQRVSGTSIATPHVVGVIALLLEIKWCDREFIFEGCSLGLSPTLKDGHGLLNARKALDVMIDAYYDLGITD